MPTYIYKHHKVPGNLPCFPQKDPTAQPKFLSTTLLVPRLTARVQLLPVTTSALPQSLDLDAIRTQPSKNPRSTHNVVPNQPIPSPEIATSFGEAAKVDVPMRVLQLCELRVKALPHLHALCTTVLWRAMNAWHISLSWVLFHAWVHFGLLAMSRIVGQK